MWYLLVYTLEWQSHRVYVYLALSKYFQAFQSSCTHLHSPAVYDRMPVAPHPHQGQYLSQLSIVSLDVFQPFWWYVTVFPYGLICISLVMIPDILGIFLPLCIYIYFCIGSFFVFMCCTDKLVSSQHIFKNKINEDILFNMSCMQLLGICNKLKCFHYFVLLGVGLYKLLYEKFSLI